jgi:hypothetical protein
MKTAAKLELALHRDFGRSIGWMGNVILVSHSSPVKKLKGLYALARENRVAPMSFSMDYILIDGSASRWSDLEKFAKNY